jgi:hypothetical protein
MPKAEEFALADAELAKAVVFNVVVSTEETGVYGDRRFGGDYDMYVGYTTLTNVPGGIRRHFNQITTDMYHHGMAENPNLDFGYIQDLINTYYSAKTYQIAYDTALEYNRYTKEHMAPQTDILFLNSTNAQARGIAGMKFTEAGINYFRYIDWDPSLLP